MSKIFSAVGVFLIVACSGSQKPRAQAQPPAQPASTAATPNIIVEQAFDSIRPEARKCIGDGRRVRVSVRYPGDGKPTNIRVIGSEPALDAMGWACLISEVKKLRYEPFDKSLTKVHELP